MALTFRSVVLGCGVYQRGTPPPEQRSQLYKLQGLGAITERIAMFAGVHVGVEVGRLRRASAVWREVLCTALDECPEASEKALTI